MELIPRALDMGAPPSETERDDSLAAGGRTSVRRGWFRSLSITAKLRAIVVVFVAVIVVLVWVMALALQIAAGVRSYVGGEGLWSKGQKDAVYYLAAYVRLRDEADYQNYLRSIALPLGDHRARLEMDKASFDKSIVREGFLAGGNAPEDIPAMIRLYRWWHGIGFFADAVGIWSEADVYIGQLDEAASRIHEAIRSGDLSEAEERQFFADLDRINGRLTPLESRFSATLARGARTVQALLLAIILVATVGLLLVSLGVSLQIARELRLGILNLRSGAIRVSRGELDHRIAVRSEDELGDLARVFNDMIAHRREAEDMLRGASEFRDKVMESATNAIYVLDLEGRFTVANRRTCEITGYSESELLGSSYEYLIPDQQLAEVREKFANVTRDRMTISGYEIPLLRKDGSELTISYSSAPLLKDGAVFAVVGTAEDVSERKRAQDQLAAHAAELERSNRELEQFAYVASHDLQEPLRTVNVFSQMLGERYRGKLDAQADEYIGFVSEGVRRMKSVIQDLLAYSRIAPQRQHFESTDLNGVLSYVLADLHGIIEQEGADVTRGDMPVLKVDGTQIAQLFQNLIGNAIKFHGSEAPKIDIRSRRLDGEWVFSVRDNGIGVNPQYAERIFVLFQRLHTRDRYPGNGIGLTICKKIVDLHGGRIWVEPGTPGSVFYFTLPEVSDA